MGITDGKAGSVISKKGFYLFVCFVLFCLLLRVKLLLDLFHIVRGEDSHHSLIFPFPESRVTFNFLLEKKVRKREERKEERNIWKRRKK